MPLPSSDEQSSIMLTRKKNQLKDNLDAYKPTSEIITDVFIAGSGPIG